MDTPRFMPTGNLTELKRLYELWADGDWTDAAIVDPHIVACVLEPTPRVEYGAEALAEYTRGFLEPWEEIRIEASEFREADNSFVVWVELRATGSASGVELAGKLVHVWTFRGRRAIRFEIFDDEAEALAAVGLSG